jgi:two-component system cell cycle sensor histidine kinase/response regulator CckA
VQQSGGHIVVESTPGEGSSFAVHLPRVSAPPEPLPASQSSPQLPQGSETVLVAEDDEMVRSLVNRILGGQGYHVLLTSNGAEALEAAARHGGKIDLLVTDVVMPGISGHELARALRAAHPGVAVLLMSGYVEDDAIRSGAIESGEQLLEKPFGPPELARAVRAALDARSGSASQ